MQTFYEWLEAVQTNIQWRQDHIPLVKGQKDAIGVPSMAEPGYRKQDKEMILKEKDAVEALVDRATARLGVHWQINYIETPHGTEETPVANAIRQMKQAGTPAWQQYSSMAHAQSADWMQQFHAKQADLPTSHPNQQPPNPNNTIVYVKPTSRVHGLDQWQQLHNIGHAVWGQARKQQHKFSMMLRDTIRDLKTQIHGPEGGTPSWAEIVTVMARLTDLKSFQRVFQQPEGDFDNPKVRSMTALNNFMEAMYEMIANYLRNGGKIKLNPRAAVGIPDTRDYVPDRRGEMQPNPEVERKFGVRPWVWKAIQGDGNFWNTLSQSLTAIIDEAIMSCVWSKVGGPIYATKGYITTKP
jgi:hypothetical protein